MGIDRDQLPDHCFRINNGTPRPATVHEELIEKHFGLLVRFLVQTLRAAEWAKDNLNKVRAVLEAKNARRQLVG